MHPSGLWFRMTRQMLVSSFILTFVPTNCPSRPTRTGVVFVLVEKVGENNHIKLLEGLLEVQCKH